MRCHTNILDPSTLGTVRDTMSCWALREMDDKLLLSPCIILYPMPKRGDRFMRTWM
jgi:hypothetical protein